MTGLFEDRRDAGRQLAAHLKHLKEERPVVLALPRGGVPVGFEIAAALAAPLDALVVLKIGAPMQPELAVGAVIDGESPRAMLDDRALRRLDLAPEDLAPIIERRRAELARRQSLYKPPGPRPALAGRTVILTDDGVATGWSMRAALQSLRERGPDEAPARLIVAVPVAPPDTLDRLREHAHDAVCLFAPDDFMAVGQFYRRFDQVEDEEVRRLLESAPPDAPPPSG